MRPCVKLTQGRFAESAATEMVIFGGMTKNGLVNDTWGWDRKTWHLLATSGPSKCAMGYMAFDKNLSRVILFGGRLGWPNDANDTWEWDGKNWSEVE